MNKPVSFLPRQFVHPKYWPTWLAIGIIRIVLLLPHASRVKAGSIIGVLGFHLARRRRHIIDVNLRLCFPDMSAKARDVLNSQVFRSTGISVIETALVWFCDPKAIQPLVTIHGLSHLAAAMRQGKGVILLGMHLSTLDFCGAVLSSYIGFDVMYRRNKNKLLEYIMTRGRQRNFPAAINRDDVRTVINNLRQGHVVWYGPDQDYGRKHSIFATFFGVTAATITATARIARISGSPIVTFTHHRRQDDSGYEIFLSEPLPDFPGDDALENANRINQIVEAAVIKAPEQYWWLHRRFKTRPEGEARPY